MPGDVLARRLPDVDLGAVGRAAGRPGARCSAASSRAGSSGADAARRVEADQVAEQRDELVAALGDAVDERLLVSVERGGVTRHGRRVPR